MLDSPPVDDIKLHFLKCHPLPGTLTERILHCHNPAKGGVVGSNRESPSLWIWSYNYDFPEHCQELLLIRVVASFSVIDACESISYRRCRSFLVILERHTSFMPVSVVRIDCKASFVSRKPHFWWWHQPRLQLLTSLPLPWRLPRRISYVVPCEA